MTDQWKGIVLGKMLNQILPGCLVSTNKYDVWIENENLLKNANKMGKELGDQLIKLQKKYWQKVNIHQYFLSLKLYTYLTIFIE